MAVTRSRSSDAIGLVSPLSSSAVEVKNDTNVSTENSKIVKRRKTKVSSAGMLLEDSLDHIEIPKDHKLPEAFVKYHSSDFIKGIEFILSKDPSLYRVIVFKNFDHFAKESPLPSNDYEISDEYGKVNYWYSLVSSVMSQQISGSAAKSIARRFKQLFKNEQPTPAEALTKSIEELKSAGLSTQKAKYILHISETFSDPNSKLSNVNFFSDSLLEEIVDELVKLKGIGVWSAKMFCIFTLNGLDVFAHDDLGIARGAARYLKRRPELLKRIKEEVAQDEELKLMLTKKSKFASTKSKRDWIPYHDAYVTHLGNRFCPYKLIFMLILWRLSSTNIDVLESK